MEATFVKISEEMGVSEPRVLPHRTSWMRAGLRGRFGSLTCRKQSEARAELLGVS